MNEVPSYLILRNDRELTFDFLILLVPTTELLAFNSGDVGIVGTVHDGGNHALGEREREIRERNINNQHDIKCLHSCNNPVARSHQHTIEIKEH